MDIICTEFGEIVVLNGGVRVDTPALPDDELDELGMLFAVEVDVEEINLD